MTEEFKPCPWCGAGQTEIVEGPKVWLGMRYGDPTSVSIRHWCPPVVGQPSRMIERIGKDRASAIAAWNARAPVVVTDEMLNRACSAAYVLVTPSMRADMLAALTAALTPDAVDPAA